jgi:hypothetical protein
MPNLHDPYLNTVKRSLDEAKVKQRKKNIENTPRESKKKFSKKIVLADYIHLPESLQKFFLLNIFIFIPYLIGLIAMFIILKQEVLKEYTDFNVDLFILKWTIGYELLAFILLLIIIKSALTFRNN